VWAWTVACMRLNTATFSWCAPLTACEERKECARSRPDPHTTILAFSATSALPLRSRSLPSPRTRVWLTVARGEPTDHPSIHAPKQTTMSALRRLLSGATTHNNTEATAPAPSPIARLSTSMSFNDMSMGTAMDAAELGMRVCV
jgi:hypothetical protein